MFVVCSLFSSTKSTYVGGNIQRSHFQTSQQEMLFTLHRESSYLFESQKLFVFVPSLHMHNGAMDATRMSRISVDVVILLLLLGKLFSTGTIPSILKSTHHQLFNQSFSFGDHLSELCYNMQVLWSTFSVP